MADSNDPILANDASQLTAMMSLAQAQIEVGVAEGERSVTSAVEIFTNMASSIEAIRALSQNSSSQEQVNKQCEQLTSDVQQAIVALQFYDILAQRLGHVSDSLDSLADLMNDDSRSNRPDEWDLLQQKLKSHYTLRNEHEVFDKVMQGLPLATILSQRQVSKDDEAELF